MRSCSQEDVCKLFVFVRANSSCWLQDRAGGMLRGVELEVK